MEIMDLMGDSSTQNKSTLLSHIKSIDPSRFTFLKTVSLSIGLSLLAACGAESDDTGVSHASNNQTIQSDSRAISGSAIKGVIRNGLVSIYGISDGVVGALLGSSATDNNGDYRVYIESSYNGPLQIVITSKTNSNSAMVCDASAGCGSYDASTTLDLNSNGLVDFGEAFILDNNFELTAAVPASSRSEIAVHVTAITHMAARYAATLSNGLHSDGIDAANSQVARLFNLSGDILTLSPTDLTNASDRDSAEEKDLVYSLIAAAVAGLSDKDTITGQIDALAQNFADLNGQLIMNGDNVDITLADLAQEAMGLADELGLNSSSASLSQLLHQSQIASADSVSEVAPSPTIGTDNLEKSKALVEDLKHWQGIIGFEEEPTLTFAQYSTELQESVLPEINAMQGAVAAAAVWGFIPVLPELAISSFCSQLGTSFIQSLCNSLVSTDSIELMCLQGSGLMIFGTDACDLLAEIKFVNTDKLRVTYFFFEGKITVEGTIENQQVDVTMSTNASSDNSLSNGVVAFNMNGTIENDGAILTLDTGQLKFAFAEAINLAQFQLPNSAEAIYTGTLTQKSTTDNLDPISYRGTLTANVDLAALMETTEAREGQGASVLLNQAALSLGNQHSADFEISLSGSLSRENGNSMDSSLVIHGGEDSYYSLNFDVVSDDLTTDANASVTGMLATESVQSQNEEGTDITSIQLSSQMAVTLDYAGRHITIERHATRLQEYEILNQDSVMLSLNFSEESDGEETRTEMGEISVNDETFATVTREGSIITFHYIDDSTAEMTL